MRLLMKTWMEGIAWLIAILLAVIGDVHGCLFAMIVALLLDRKTT
jgi:hypothetical protein